MMIVIHDIPNSDLGKVPAVADICDGFALFDYVEIIDKEDRWRWVGQIIEPNRNLSTVNSNRIDATILHGLYLVQDYPEVECAESVHLFEIKLLGQYQDDELMTPRLRPIPGSKVQRLDQSKTTKVLSLPELSCYPNSTTTNVIGELVNATGVPLCINPKQFNYHIMICGGTGSGKSNVCANLVRNALKSQNCVILHDAKPDYSLCDQRNDDPNIRQDVWSKFRNYGIVPEGIQNIIRVGFYQECDPDKVDVILGFKASDFQPELLGRLFFPHRGEQLQAEGFINCVHTLRENLLVNGREPEYTIEDIIEEVKKRTKKDSDEIDEDQIHAKTGNAIVRKIKQRKAQMPWLDVVGVNVEPLRKSPRFDGSILDGETPKLVCRLDLEALVEPERLIVVDYSTMNEQSYALILSYFLRECQKYRSRMTKNSNMYSNGYFYKNVGIVQLVDEAHRIFDNESNYTASLENAFERALREGRSVEHSIILSLQNASQIPERVMNNLNTKIIMRQNSRGEAESATRSLGKEFLDESLCLGTGQALVYLFESKSTVLAQMAPSPFKLIRGDQRNEINSNIPSKMDSILDVVTPLEF